MKKIDAKGYAAADNDDERYGWTYTYDLANVLFGFDPELAAKNIPGVYTWTYVYNTAGEKIKQTNALGAFTKS